MKPQVVFATILFAVISGTCSELESESGNSLNINIENDSRNIGGPGSDQSYTNGFRISYVLANNERPKWVNSLTNWSDYLKKEFNKSNTNYGIFLSHQIYSPSNTNEKKINLEDRPYAAWLNLGLTAHFRDQFFSHLFSLGIGVIGPAALGEEVQNNFHNIIGATKAKGWNGQLNNEPTVQLFYQKRARFFELTDKQKKYLDIIPFYGTSLGNVLTEVHAGGLFRIGINIPNDFGPTRGSSGDGDKFNLENFNPTSESNLYFFSGGRGIIVLRNIFLDGNTNIQSQKVTKYNFILESEFGAGFRIKRWDLLWRFVTRSPEFREQSYFNSFASVSITYSL